MLKALMWSRLEKTLGLPVQAYHPITQEAEAGGNIGRGPAWATDDELREHNDTQTLGGVGRSQS